jgi:hypothetical protein
MSLINEGLSLANLYESENRDMRRVQVRLKEFMDEDKMKAAGLKLLKPEVFSIKEMYDFCESVDVTQFPTLTATLIEKQVINHFQAFPGIGDQLVTSFPSSLQISKIPGSDVTANFRDIEPGMPYHHDADITEKFVQIEGKKRGDILDITEEAILHDQTGLVLREAGRFGMQAAIDREKKILYTIQDQTVAGINYYAYYPSGTRVALYSGTVAGTHPYSNLHDNALQHWTDLDIARTMFSAMRDVNAEPIWVRPKILLVPVALETVAMRLINNTLLPAAKVGQTVVGDSQMEANPFSKAFTVLSSPYLDIISTAFWYLGDFKAQFLLKSVYPIQVITRRDRVNDAAWERDIIAQYKVRYFEQPGAVDYKYVVKSRGTRGTCPSESYCSSWGDGVVP